METRNETRTRLVVTIIISVLIAEAVGFLSSLFAGDIRGMFEMMNLPPLTPPGGVFGPVWTIMYALMGAAIAIVFHYAIDKRTRNLSLALYIIQLALNFIWSIIFFGGDAMWIGLIIIVALDIVVILNIAYYYKTSKVASLLMVPYLIWILFATYLTLGCAILN